MSGWDVAEWAVAIAAAVTAVGVIWRKVGRPLKNATIHTYSAVMFIESMMHPNGGSSIVDRMDRLERSVAVLLEHDAERDVAGKRYE